MKTIFLLAILLLCPIYCVSAANVAIIDAEGKYNVNEIAAVIKLLGHKSEKLKADWLFRAIDLNDFHCIVLTGRSCKLTKEQFQVLQEYTADGGMLLLFGQAGYWLKTPGKKRGKTMIAGEGPLKEISGAKFTHYRQDAIRKLTVLDKKSSLTRGLPDSFAMETTPKYDVENPATWRRAGTYHIKATTAKTLIAAEVINKKGDSIKVDLLTWKRHGNGKCCRLSISYPGHTVLAKREKHIARIISNLLNYSEKLD